MNRFKYTVGPGLFREYTQLFTDLNSALLALEYHYPRLGLVPGGHKPHRAFEGRPANETTPFRAELSGRPWEVVKVFTYTDQEKSETWLAEFYSPHDAFAFAEMKTKLAKQRGEDSTDSFFVSLRGWTEDRRFPELARLRYDHLSKLIQAKRRANDRKLNR